ncbi:MAG: TRIC cation channel family protein [Lachnospiraceae bacterium]|nr:TRIC cation channel family protein [Lachnospiraceae bacterium]
MYLFLEILGTIAFAVSGAMVAIRARMDLLGVVVLGMTTAVGGGIIRDVLIGVVPPMAFQKPVYAVVAIMVSLVVFLPKVRTRIHTDVFLFNLIDAIGLGIFTVVGVKAGIPFENPYLQFFLGTVTGVGGGVMRDVFASEKPMIFVKHFYAAASMIGALVCIALMPVSESAAMVVSAGVVVFLRILAADRKWNLPRA